MVPAASAVHPRKAALLAGDRTVTYAELEDRVVRAAGGLAELGVSKGDRVALLLGTVPEFVEVLHGAWRLGAVVAPLNVLVTPDEAGSVLADAEAKIVVAARASLPVVLAVRDRLAELDHVVVVGGRAPRRTRSYEKLLAGATEPPSAEVEDADLALLAYTAGTTASPKGAMLTHGNLMANLDQMSEVPALREAEADVVLVALPLFHVYALNVVLGITIRERRDADLSSVRIAVSGAAALPGEVFRAFRERFGVTIWEGYGLTETAPAVTTNALGPEPKADSIGLVLPGIDVRLVDEHDEDVEEGDPGEIVVRGPNVFAGYWRKPVESETSLRTGWFRTGDVAYRDEDGYLHIVDRAKDLVIVSGFNVYPREVEEAIALHPGVSECTVIGVPDKRTGEAVKAIVVPVPEAELTAEDVLEHCRGRLARFKWPKEVEIVSELPKHVTGKVLRRRLREGGR
jgi:long-chain acyl-CoA synthetase